MESARFDRLATLVGTGATRRALFTLLTGLGVGGVNLLDSAAVEAGGKCKPKCPECKRCQCKKTKHGKKCKCKPKPDGTACSVGTCQGGTCVAAAITPPPACPPLCPVCLGCNGQTGQCEALPSLQGKSALGCAAPKICCAGSCCDPIHACNSARTCASCAETCPATCTLCLTLAGGGTQCAVQQGFFYVSSATCSSSSPCPTQIPHCMLSYTNRSTNVTTYPCDSDGGCCSTAPACPPPPIG
jgi:hypothetical protein